MKKFVKAISGERALYIVMVLAVLASVMEIITALRTHVNIDYQGMGAYWIALCAWATAIDNTKNIAGNRSC